MTVVIDFPVRRAPAPTIRQRAARVVAPILVAVDLGEDSRAAALWAGELAESTGAPLRILHVLHDPAENPGKYARHKANPLEPMADTARRMLAEFMDQLRAARPGVSGFAEASAMVAKGLPAQTIVNEARVLGAGLIVMGCRSKSSWAKLLYGSNAEKVTRLSPIPVTVVKAPSA